MQAQVGTSHGTLLTRRIDELKPTEEEELNKELQDISFSSERQGKHRLMLISETDPQSMYQFMYQVAAFNFTRFMVKEFDLELNQLDETQWVLSVTNFESYDEVLWYRNSINADLTLGSMLKELNIQEVAISETNFEKFKVVGLDEYLQFDTQYLSKGKAAPVTPAESWPVNDVIPEEQPATQEEQAVTAPEPKEETVSEEQTQEKTAADTETKEITQEKIQEAPLEVTPTTENVPDKDAPVFKGLFAYEQNKPHYVALYVISGKPDTEKVLADFNAYNAENYGMLNLNISVEKTGAQQMIIIGSFPDANIAQSYLLRVVKEKTLYEGLKGSNYRNLLGTKYNLNVMINKNALRTYNEFMQEYYLK